MVQFRILVVDDEDAIRHLLKSVLQKRRCEVRDAASAEDALRVLEAWEPEVALVDIFLPGMNGLQLLGEIKQRYRDSEVLIMTGDASADTALQAMRLGASDYLKKPFDLDDVWTTVQRAQEKRRLALRNRELVQREEARARELSATLSLVEPDHANLETDACTELLDDFLDMLTQELDVERASVMLLDESTQELTIAASRGVETIDPDAVRVPVGEGIAGRVARTGEPFLATSVKSDGRLQKVAYPSLADSFVSAPILLSVAIRGSRDVLGVINITNRRSGKQFGQSDLNFLSSLSSHLAVALEGVKRTEQLRKAYASLKAAQDELVFSERIQAVGQMASGVAHDFNNVLSVILARAQFAHRRLTDGKPDLEKVTADLLTIQQSALHGAEVIKRIQDYTRVRKDVPTAPVDLNQVVENAVEMARPKWKEECEAEGRPVEIRMELADVPQVRGNVHELTQVVGNLIFNAVDAMPEGGNLFFRTSVEGDAVTLQVEDTGTGMDAATRERLFEPFFTTKESGQGLGMAIIYGIISRHQGQIDVDSRLGQGTAFSITLPRLPQVERVAEPRHEGIDETSFTASVLLVDDDTLVRETYEEALEISGHQVCGVSSARDALALFEMARFDVVVTDLSMPGMSGLELAAELKRQDPRVPVILLSGWAVQQSEERITDAGIVDVLVKPCLIEDLLRAVGRAIRGRAVNDESDEVVAAPALVPADAGVSEPDARS